MSSWWRLCKIWYKIRKNRQAWWFERGAQRMHHKLRL